jgi:Glycosyltransferase family 87
MHLTPESLATESDKSAPLTNHGHLRGQSTAGSLQIISNFLNTAVKLIDSRGLRAPPRAPETARQRKQLSRLQLAGLFILICVVLGLQARQGMWNEHLGRDVGEFWIRTEKYLAFQLPGTEYPPFAMLYFLLLRWAEFTFHVGFATNFLVANYVLLGLHLALLNRVAGRASAILFGALILAAGSIVLFRYELLVSFLTLVAWCAWRHNWPRCAGALLAAAILSKLYPLLLLPLFARPPADGDLRRQVITVSSGLGLGLAGILMLFWLGGDPISSFSGVIHFHENKPVGLESTPAAVAMAFDAARGAWPSHSVNEYSIHGLRLPSLYRWLMQLGFLASMGALLYSYWKRRGNLILTAQAMLVSLVFWTTLFQPQYLIWPVAFTALLPLTGLEPRRLYLMGGLFALALATEQIVFPCHYTEFLAIFYEHRPADILILAMAISKLAVTALFVIALLAACKPPETIAGED